MSKETQVKFNAAINNWEALTPAVLSDPVNADLLLELKKYALGNGKSDIGAVLPLLNMGDPDVIASCVEVFRDGFRRGDVQGAMERCSQPKVIVAIGDDLNRNESTRPKHHEDVGEETLSVAATKLIEAIVLNSPAFGDSVRRWAKELDRLGYTGRDEQRDSLRVWWAENKELLKAERYAEVKPPSDWTPSTYMLVPPGMPVKVKHNPPSPLPPPSAPSTPVAAIAKTAPAYFPKWPLVVTALALAATGAVFFFNSRSQS